ncbi:MAG: DUF4384 domain-containing protein [Blastocatellia bacterium]
MKKLVILLAFVLSINILAIAQEGNNVNTREFFLSSRIKKPTKKPTNKKAKEVNKEVNGNKQNSEPIGLGYTLYLRDEKDNGVRVDPERIFKSGDAVRLSLEPNIDGYLYIFYVENEGEPELLYPDARLNAGDNTVKAHVPLEIPSRTVKDPNLRWFFFSGDPAKEKLYVMVTKNPLPNVPIGKDLVKYQQENKSNFKPSNETWGLVKAKASEPNLVSKNNDYGQQESQEENKAVTRKLSLGNNAPAPSTVKVSKSAKSDMFATVVELKHE